MKIKDTPKVKKIFTRQCVICGESFLVNVFPNGKYSGGNYFGRVEVAESYRDTGKTFDLGNGARVQIADPVGKVEKSEYWECDKCYKSWDK